KIAVAADQGAGHIDLDAFALFFENPAMQRVAREPHPCAIMRPEIAGFLRYSMVVKIFWRRHHRRLGILSEAKGYHILFDAVARSNAGIEAIAHDVGQGTVDHDLERDRRICAEESRQDGLDDGSRRRTRHGDPQMARGAIPEYVDR